MAIQSVSLLEAVLSLLTNNKDSLGIKSLGERFDANEEFPRLQIEAGTTLRDDNKITDGHSHLIQLHIWSKYDGSLECRQVAAAIQGLLHRRELNLSDGTIARVVFESFRDLGFDPDIDTLRHGVIEIEATTQSAQPN